ncbi:MAG: glycoside hydrolase family 127 protein [Clostridia bacterium]|nr:glycoside hydrolase family 127 protein [Clostridia bacterium]
MKRFQKLDKFPLGSIRAKGFLRDQMLIGKDGMAGHLYEIEPEMIYHPFVDRKPVPAWEGDNQAGWGAEISGNYWAGYIQHAYTLDDPEMIAVAEDWVNKVLKNIQPDGYLGTYYLPGDNIYQDYNAWGTACGMRGLIAFYEATGRKDVLDAVYNCMLWFCDKWAGDKKTTYAGQSIIEPMVLTYYHTGDERLIKFCEDYLDFICRNDHYKLSYKSMLSDDYMYLTMHAGALGSKPKLPALVYSVTGNEDYLKAGENLIRKARAHSIQLTGGAVSSVEYNGPVGGTMETEYCCFTFMNQSYSILSYITGNSIYGDYMEEVFYNGAQGARKKDEKCIPYLSAPNQVFATHNSSLINGDQQQYAPVYPTSCCPVNAVAIVPDFVRGMLLRDEADNVYVVAYGPCTLDYKDISIEEKTLYPFRNNSEFVINCNKKFALNLKVPQWSEGVTLKLNGEEIPSELSENGYISIDREWKCGDTVEIAFKASVKVIKVDDSDGASKYPIAFKYGALLYSYHIPEDWRKAPGRPMTALSEDWSWYSVYPLVKDIGDLDPVNRILARRELMTWNIAVDENLTAEDFEIEELEPNGYAWENPMIKLRTHCYKAPYLCALYPARTFEPHGQYQYVTKKLPLELVPHGCTNLRITYFAKADLKNMK